METTFIQSRVLQNKTEQTIKTNTVESSVVVKETASANNNFKNDQKPVGRFEQNSTNTFNNKNNNQQRVCMAPLDHKPKECF